MRNRVSVTTGAAVAADNGGAGFSAAAQRLYRSLLDGPGPPASGDCPQQAVHELVELGLVQVEDDRVVGVCPRQGQSNLADVLHEHSKRMLERLAEVSEFLGACERAATEPSRAGVPGAGDAVRIVTDPAEVVRLSTEIPSTARQGYCSVHTGRLVGYKNTHLLNGPAARPRADRDVRARIVVGPDLAREQGADPILAAGISNGEQVRCHPAPPLKFLVVDGSVALLPLDDSGAAGALVVESVAVGSLLSWTFEHLWSEAGPLTRAGRGAAGLDPVHLRILRLFAEDAGDPEIAAALGICERSLRRHVATLLDRLGVGSRHAAVAATFRSGLLP